MSMTFGCGIPRVGPRSMLCASPRVSLRVLLCILVCMSLSACGFDGVVAPTVQVICASGNDCPEGWVCLADRDRCAPENSACVAVPDDRRVSTSKANGSDCGGGFICVDGLCSAPRCGDGVRTAGESCDGSQGCRSDCTRCGDGVLDAGESCDEGAANSNTQPNACRTTCVPFMCGDGVRDLGESCDDGLENSDALPNACRTSCALPTCGDGVVDPGEGCDEGFGNSDTSANGCRTRCEPSWCGDGILDEGESCDEGAANSNVQPNACRTSCVPHRCGDGVRDLNEGCDDGVGNSDVQPNACRMGCVLPTCGDRVQDMGEGCDAGLENSDVQPNACRTSCALPRCGDGVLDEGEGCDDGPANSDVLPNACRTSCIPYQCGDGVRDIGEGCDEGRGNSDVLPDACRIICALPGCGDGVMDPGEDCDDGYDNSDDVANACRTRCALPRCGDGVVDEGETCDEGAANSDIQPNACRTSCELFACGDGTQDLNEECDDGILNSDVVGSACRSGCTRPACGDSLLDLGELCDDGNTESGDGCRADCLKVEVCGDGLLDEQESCDDGNENPRDGCDDCSEQAWNSELIVSGSVGGRAASTAALNPAAVAVDALGRVYVTSRLFVQRIDPDGSMTTVAGNGTAGFTGDGIPATNSGMMPTDVAVDPNGRIYIVDAQNLRIRRVDIDGTITTIAGTGASRLAGCASGPEPATSQAFRPTTVAVDSAGRIMFSEKGCIYRIGLDGFYERLAGTQTPGFSGDGGPATSAQLVGASSDYYAGRNDDLIVDGAGGIFFIDGYRVRRIGSDGVIQTVAGTGAVQWTSSVVDGLAAISTPLCLPSGLSVDAAGRVLIAEWYGNRVRRIETNGTLSTVAGTGGCVYPPYSSFSGDGGAAIMATLSGPTGIGVDPAGRIVIADGRNLRLRRVDSDGTIGTIAGTGSLPSPDEAVATSFMLAAPTGIAWDALGRILIADQNSHRVFALAGDGTISTFAGTGEPGFSGDGGPATRAALNNPTGLVVDHAGRVLIADTENDRIRRVEVDGSIQTIAGGGSGGDGGLATQASFNGPVGLAMDGNGRILVTDCFNRRIRRIDDNGIISTVAGSGVIGFSGDGGPAMDASMDYPIGIAVDPVGTIIFADSGNNRIRRIDVNGTITTIAGTGARESSGDGGLATSAAVAGPYGVSMDGDGNVMFTEPTGSRVRRIAADGIISTVAGGAGNSGGSVYGDGGPAVRAGLQNPLGIILDDANRIVFTGGGVSVHPVFALSTFPQTNYVRRIESDGTVVTLAGSVHPPGPGSAAKAKLYASTALTTLPTGNIVSVDETGRAVHIDLAASVVAVAVGLPNASMSAAFQARFAPLFQDARGVAFDAVARTLVVTEHTTGHLRIIGLDPDGDGATDPFISWTNASITTALGGPAGIAFDADTDTFLVVDEEFHCVQRVGRDGTIIATVFGRCGTPGVFPGFLNNPSHVVVSPTSGAVYIADSGNHRVLRIDANGSSSVVLGDGSRSSAGEGTPARLFPVNTPRQLACDRHGNLYVASTTVVRLVANVDGDVDADGDDRVFSVFGGGERVVFPESDSFCVGALTLGMDDSVYAADACQGFLVRLTPVTERVSEGHVH